MTKQINILKLYPRHDQAKYALMDFSEDDPLAKINGYSCYADYDCGLRIYFRSGKTLDEVYNLAGMCFVSVDFCGVFDKEVKSYIKSRVRWA